MIIFVVVEQEYTTNAFVTYEDAVKRLLRRLRRFKWIQSDPEELSQQGDVSIRQVSAV